MQKYATAIAAAGAVVVLFTAAVFAVIMLPTSASAAVNSSYIITLKANAGTAQCATDRNAINVLFNITPTALYDTVFCGESAKLTGKTRDLLRKDPRVATVEPDRIVRAAP